MRDKYNKEIDSLLNYLDNNNDASERLSELVGVDKKDLKKCRRRMRLDYSKRFSLTSEMTAEVHRVTENTDIIRVFYKDRQTVAVIPSDVCIDKASTEEFAIKLIENVNSRNPYKKD